MSISNKKPQIMIIGGAEMFIQNRPAGQLQFGPENPGTISIGCTGNAWTLASDLVEDGCGVEFVSVAGNDFAGQAIKARLGQLGIGTAHFHLINDADTAAKHLILNLLDQPEMEFENGDVFSSMTKEMVASAATGDSLPDCVVLETRFPKQVLEYVAVAFPKTPILLMPESEQSAAKATGMLNSVQGILSGRRPSEILSGLSILSEEELLAAVEWFYHMGISKVFIDLSFGGVCYQDAQGKGIKRPGPIRQAAIVEGFALNHSAEETAERAVSK